MTVAEEEAAPPQVQRQVVPLAGAWDLLVRGWRPLGGWVCVMILLARGVIVPLTQLYRREPIEPIDLVALTALAGVLGLARWRTQERIAGVTG